MTDDPRVRELLDELLNSQATPEEVCRACPELLSKVRARWRAVRRVQSDLDALFPASPEQSTPMQTATTQGATLPAVPGYEVEAVLGRGGMGVVYRALHLRLKRPVALKMLLAGAYARPAELERFLREAEAVAGLRHPNIVQVHDVGDVEGRPYFTMEFIEGGNLTQKIQGVPQPARQAATLVATLAEAVHAAHQSGIMHRDLKPGNILLTKDGTPKVTDFGLARRLEGDGGLTISGTPMGTPSYMSPEQARCDKAALGPATDVYALGAILYELLTGRPPFRGETGAATLQQVLADEPVTPARLNPRVPRDLVTICLKCLQKKPGSRYSSARELADDLRRFLNDEEIRARPPGLCERSYRWLRRRPTLATSLGAALLLMTCLLGGAWWLNRQQGALVRGVEDDLREAASQRKNLAWTEAAATLERAKGRLGLGGPAELQSRVEQAARRLDHARQDLALAPRLEAVRMKRATFVEGYFDSAAERRFTNARADQDYEEAFRQAGFGDVGTDLAVAAARVQDSDLREALMSGLTDWAVCAAAPDRQDWLLAVAREADPDPWSNRVRDPAVWRDGPALAALAREAPVAEGATPLLIALAERLQLTGEDATGFLQQLCREHPANFWANFILGNVLRAGGKPQEAAACYLQALEVRFEAAVQNNLGLAQNDTQVMANLGDRDKSIYWYQKALQRDPGSVAAHNSLGLALKAKGQWDAGVKEFRLALQIDPGAAPVHCNLGVIRAYAGDMNEAIEHLQEAVRLDPGCPLAHYYLGSALLGKHFMDAANASHKEDVRRDAKNKHIYDLAFAAVYPNALCHYHWVVDLDPKWARAEITLGLAPQCKGLLETVLEQYDRALKINPRFAEAEAGRGQMLLAQGDFAEALASTRRCLDLLGQDSERADPKRIDWLRRNLTTQLERCKRLLELERRLPAVLLEEEKPAAHECIEFAELCGIKGQYAAAARLYAEGFAAKSNLAENVNSSWRYTPACAAALAGWGRGNDAAWLSDAERARWRRQARSWLRADLAAWFRKVRTITSADPNLLEQSPARWWADPCLAWIHDPEALKELSPEEQQECKLLWEEFAAQLSGAQAPSRASQ